MEEPTNRPYGNKRRELTAAILCFLTANPGQSIRQTSLYAASTVGTSEAWSRFQIYRLEQEGVISIGITRRGAACFLAKPGEALPGVLP